jgi:hypothetical protein
MRHDDTLTASAETRARLRVESTPFDYPWPSRQGDFAAGLRTQPLDDCTHGSFATGVARALLFAGRPIGDFAGGVRPRSRPRVIGDFATGMTAPNNAQPRHRGRGPIRFRARPPWGALGDRVNTPPRATPPASSSPRTGRSAT